MGSLPCVVEDCLGIVQVFSDGTISRTDDIKFPMKVHDDGSAVWKDCLFDTKQNLSLRLYKPRSLASDVKLPIVYYFHGGGFCIGSRTWPNCHSCCLRLASGLQVLVVAPDYRLAPEHRLPAAVDDAMTAVKWLQHQAKSISNACDEWLRDGVDFDKVFVVGDSSGGNMAHHLAVELRRGSTDLAPVRIRGYVLLAPFFGGTVRTKAEAQGVSELFLNVETLDRFWRLSLPSGSTSDHPLANPFGPSSPNLEDTNLDPILVIVGGNELMKDRIEDYAMRLKKMGKEIDYVLIEGQEHGFFTNEPFSKDSDSALKEISNFMTRNSI